LVLVVDDVAMIRELLSASLGNAGYDFVCAAGGQQALATLDDRVPDLVLLDLNMPGIDGLGVLRAMRNRPDTKHTPVILLTASSDKEHIVAAARFGVRDYILKSKFSLSELLTRVGKYVPPPRPGFEIDEPASARKVSTALKPSVVPPPSVVAKKADAPPAKQQSVALTGGEVPQLMDREECIKRAEIAMQARTLSGVVAQVIALAASPRGDMSDLTSLIARDSLLAARVLQAANSVSYASTRGVVATLAEAVRNIGCATVRDIAASMGVFDAMPPSGPDGFNPIRCWQHSFAVATLCNRLAPEDLGGSAYLVGLCHDLGEILFHSHFGEEYRKVLEVQEATGRRRDVLERMMLGMTHGELVQTILRCLGLPEEIRKPIASFHEAGFARAAAHPMARLLQVADLYATGVLLASSEHSPLRPLSKPECRNAVGCEDPARPDGVPLRGEIYGLTAMLARLSPKDEAKLMEPPYGRRSIKVMLVRDPSLSAFDPLEAALESLAEVQVRHTLPTRADLVGIDAAVVAARSTSAAGFTASEIHASINGGADRVIPVLWLAGRIDEGASTDSPNSPPISWPVPLSHLADFIRQV